MGALRRPGTDPIPIPQKAKGPSEDRPKCFLTLVGRARFELATYELRVAFLFFVAA